MKRLQKLAVFLLALLLVTVPALAAAPTKADKKEAERQELRTKTYQALKLLYEKKLVIIVIALRIILPSVCTTAFFSCKSTL